MERWILHVDMDEFFAAVERRDDPSLVGKCLLVGTRPEQRGVVATASYEARRFGCHSAMPMSQALRLCPHAVILPPRGSRYAEVSRQVFAIFERFTPQIQPLSIDEAFLDVTGTESLFGPAEQVARQIKAAIRNELKLIASVGIASNPFLAKLASDMDKPDGLTVIPPNRVQAILDPLPVERLWGIGTVTAQRLKQLGVTTVGLLRQLSDRKMVNLFGNQADHFRNLAHGRDHRRVTPDHNTKSISQEQTFPMDVGDIDELRRVLLQQTEQVARRLRAAGLLAKTVSLKLREGDFTTLSRSVTLDQPTNETSVLWKTAREIFDAWARPKPTPLRLVGMAASNLRPPGGVQLNLFEQTTSEKHQKLDSALDRINEKYGPDAIGRGRI